MTSNLPKSFFVDRNLPVTERHDVYPTIDPQLAFETKEYNGKVVLVAGASRGIGQTIALFYARAGATVVLVARSSLDETKNMILQKTPDAKLLEFSADVTNSDRADEVVRAVVAQCGKLDILIANAASGNGFAKRIGEQVAADWWNTLRVNLFGSYNYVRASLEHVENSGGYIIVVSGGAAIARVTGASDYLISKHALNRLVELVALEYPTVKAFAVHPGRVLTPATMKSVFPKEHFPDSRELSAATMLKLTSGKYDWLNAKFVDSTWDLGEVERDWKEKIVQSPDSLVNRFALP